MLPTLSPSLYLRIYSSENQKILKMMFLWIFDVHKYVRTKEGTVRDLAQHSESQYPIRYRAEAYRLKIKKKTYVPTKLQIVYFVTKNTDFNMFFTCTIWHDFMVHVHI